MDFFTRSQRCPRLAAGRSGALPRRAASGRCRAIANKKGGTVTEEDILQEPWSKPGYFDAYVSELPLPAQTATVAGITLLGALLTFINFEYLGPWTCENIPTFDRYMGIAPVIQSALFVVAGVAHFTLHETFCRFYPHKGAWGFWYLPGTPSFHVNWTGVAEILGGTGVVLGRLAPALAPSWLLPASSFGVFLLLVVVTPSNMYMWTHNAPGPLTEEEMAQMDGPRRLGFHLFRGWMQVVLLSTFLTETANALQ